MIESRLFDYIIVGAGSAGCALAYQLTSRPSISVLLIEAGTADKNMMSVMPKGFAKIAIDPRHSWAFHTEEQPHRDRAGELWQRGRIMGGSSAINGMIYVRGQREDYDDWRRLGNVGWGADDVMRCYRAMEDHSQDRDDIRGRDGPLRITAGHFRYPFADRLIATGQSMGLPRNDGFNGAEQEGIGYIEHTIRNGRRESAARAFIDPIRRRPNLTIAKGVEVNRIAFEGRRAARVLGTQRGKQVSFAAKGEIILCAGTMNTPKLLQLSGIGDAAYLRTLGIDILHHSPAVGAHMRDHQSISHIYRLQGERGNNAQLVGAGLVRSILRYGLRRDGILSTGPLEIGAFARSKPGLDRPDIQLMMGPISTAPMREGVVIPSIETQPGLTLSGYILRPITESSVRVRSADPADQIIVDAQWLTAEEDIDVGVAIMRLLRDFVRQPALAPFIAREISPGSAVETPDDMRAFFLRHARTANHATGTCRMGPDENFVTDDRLRVRGVDGLRIADCSIMPTQVSGNTNGPAMVVGWRAGEIILEDAA